MLFSFYTTLNAQNIVVSNELGVFLGPTFMQTDYGEAEQFDSSINNTGFSFGVAYIADFSSSRLNSGFGRAFTEHVKLRGELSYMRASFAYDGKPTESLNTESALFKAMKGNTKILSIGIFTEINVFNLNNDKKLQPYLILGGSYSSVDPNLESSLTLPSIYLPEEDYVFMEKQNVFSYSGGIGTRYKLDEIDIVFEYRLTNYTSDKVEGLESSIAGNKNNDTQTNFNIGVVFHLE